VDGRLTVRVGIGGWTYAPWRGVFYPDGLVHRRELEYAAQHLTAIEINATFYGRQKPASWRKWGEAAPDGFQFTVKASRYSTARKVLAEGAAHIAGGEEDGPRTETAPVDQLLSGVVEEARYPGA